MIQSQGAEPAPHPDTGATLDTNYGSAILFYSVHRFIDRSNLNPKVHKTMSDDLLSGFKEEPWNYMHTVHYKKLKSYTFATDGHDLFMYDTDLGGYIPADDKLRNVLSDIMRHDWTPKRVNDIFTWYKDRAPRLWDTPTLDRVNVLNGILDLESGELEPHSPDFLSPIQINAAWDPEAECPAIDRFVQGVFPYDAHEVFYQLAGLFLTPDSRCQKAVLFLGSGASGKSVATALLRTFLGPRNVSNVPLHDITEGSYALAELRGKLLNISADVPERSFDDTATFKQIVDGQLAILRVPRKHREPIAFQPFTRLLASAARVPQSADNSLGYLRRWLAVPFDTTLNVSNLDRTLLDKLTTPEELSGLLNRAIYGYQQVLTRGTLSESDKMARAKEEFDQESDSTRAFLEERVQECSPYEEIDRTELYNAYKDWCAFNRLNPVSAHRLYNSVWEIFRVETRNTHGRRLFRGIELVPVEGPEGEPTLSPVEGGAAGADAVQE